MKWPAQHSVMQGTSSHHCTVSFSPHMLFPNPDFANTLPPNQHGPTHSHVFRFAFSRSCESAPVTTSTFRIRCRDPKPAISAHTNTSAAGVGRFASLHRTSEMSQAFSDFRDLLVDPSYNFGYHAVPFSMGRTVVHIPGHRTYEPYSPCRRSSTMACCA